tara:strand:+ start:216 stop:758 length:543 start_codon:yes stop_codon:yes gene_type:complete
MQNLPNEMIFYILNYFFPSCICSKNDYQNLLLVNKMFYKYIELHSCSNSIINTKINIHIENFQHFGFKDDFILCKVHEKKDISYYNALKMANIEGLFKYSIRKKYPDIYNNFNNFNYLNDIVNEKILQTHYLHFASIEDAERYAEKFKKDFQKYFSFNGYCCNGKGVVIDEIKLNYIISV